MAIKRVIFTVAFFCILSIACGICACESNSNDNFAGQNTEQSEEQDASSESDTEQEIEIMYIHIGDKTLEVKLENNAACEQLKIRLSSGDIVYTAGDYGGFEKVGNIGFSLPTDDKYMTSSCGDVYLYCGNQIVIFYGSNSWEYTPIGKIQNADEGEIRAALGAGSGDVQIILSKE